MLTIFHHTKLKLQQKEINTKLTLQQSKQKIGQKNKNKRITIIKTKQQQKKTRKKRKKEKKKQEKKKLHSQPNTFFQMIFHMYNLGKNIMEKFTKLNKTGFSR